MSNKVNLQLNDIILFIASGTDIDQKIYIIDYIDNQYIKLINDISLEEYTLQIDEEGNLSNKNITGINLLNRSEQKGFARQNDLLPDQWIDIYFGGDLPTTITGKISNLEEDMIEILTYPDNDTIYIDFAYKGIPVDLPIEKITLREAPILKKGDELEKIQLQQLLESTKQDEDLRYQEYDVPEATIRTKLRDTIIDADAIQFGEELEEITQLIDVSVEKQRFSIEEQCNDLLDELLSTIPNNERTPKVLNKLHILIERFKQLRTLFSDFDARGHANRPHFKGADFKPLINYLYDLNRNLYWIMPVVRNSKKLYDLEGVEPDEYNNIDPLTLASDFLAIKTIVDNYNSNSSSSTNRYDDMMKELNPYLTPYTNVVDQAPIDGCLTLKPVQTNLHTIANNLSNYETNVASHEMIQRRRFLIQKYNLGLKQLHSQELNGPSMVSIKTTLTPNDTMCLSSYMTLPEPTVRFSHINLPQTSILTKTNLNIHFLQYWQLLNKSTNTTTRTLGAKNEQDLFQHDSTTFLSDIQDYIWENPIDEEEIGADEKFKIYLNQLVPKTKVLFNLIKKNITGKLSLVHILNYLEPFMIYHDDLTYKQYEDIVSFINEKILEWIVTFEQNKRLYNSLKQLSSGKPQEPNLIKLLTLQRSQLKEEQTADETQRQVITAYGINSTNTYTSSSEMLKKMLHMDQTRFYVTGVAKTNMDLFMTEDVENYVETSMMDFSEKFKKSKEENSCEKYVLTKIYNDDKSLTDDNQKMEIFYDKTLDPTPYDILDEYKAEKASMPPAQFRTFLHNELEENMGLPNHLLAEEVVTLTLGKKIVKPGEYALLEIKTDSNDITRSYYVRKDNEWVLDTNMTADLFTNSNKFFCDLQERCYAFEKKSQLIDSAIQCDDLNLAKGQIRENFQKLIRKEFDIQQNINSEILERTINYKYAYDYINLGKLKLLNYFNALKYNNEQVKIGETLNIEDIIISPNAKCRDLILGQTDFAKKQEDIILFKEKFTRSARREESSRWLYCITSDIKLLPIFLYELAITFKQGENYVNKLNQLCKEIGTISDDGEAYIDKYSGYVIRYIDFDDSEGYDDKGRRETRESIAQSISDEIIGDIGETAIPETPEAKMVYKIVNVVSERIGVNLKSERSFIIGNVIIKFKSKMEDEKTYNINRNKAILSGKKRPEYIIHKNNQLLLLTLSYITIALQTMLPPPRTNKTFEGCKKSFEGYPLESTDNFEGLTYIACIANKIKSSAEPWNTIQKIKEPTLVKNILTIMRIYGIVSDPDVQERIHAKNTYMQEMVDIEIPPELDLKNWNNFLPPLIEFELGSIENITPAFKKLLAAELKKGSPQQFNKINVIQGKIITFSLSIQEIIGNIIKEAKPLLKNVNQIPFIDNVCCNEGKSRVYDFFAEQNKTFIKNNEIVSYLTNYLYTINAISTAPVLFDPTDTKTKYPVISPEFTSDTIYRAFIVYCKLGKDVPLEPELQKVCVSKNEFSSPRIFDENDDEVDAEKQETEDIIFGTNSTMEGGIEAQIKKLKAAGNNYTIESLNQLMNVINKRNIVPINFNTKNITQIDSLKSLLLHLEGHNDGIPAELTQNLNNLLAMAEADMRVQEDNAQMRTMKNYLGKINDSLRQLIMRFIRTNNKLTQAKKRELDKFFDNIKSWSDMKYIDEKELNIQNSLFEFLKNITKVYPNIILNRVKHENISIPNHWKLTDLHNRDIRTFISKYYKPLEEYFSENDDHTLQNILKQVQINGTDILLMAENTPFIPQLMRENIEKSVIDTEISTQLFELYVYLLFKQYIDLSVEERPLVEQVRSVGQSVSPVELEEEGLGEITEIDIVAGETRLTKEMIAKLLLTYITMYNKNKSVINYSYTEIIERILLIKDKEKTQLVTERGQMSDEVREIDTTLQHLKLGDHWGKGLQKGLTQYVGETYDTEREDQEKQLVLNMAANAEGIKESNLRESFMRDQLSEDQILADEQNEHDNIDELPDDDDYGELDGDEAF